MNSPATKNGSPTSYHASVSGQWEIEVHPEKALDFISLEDGSFQVLEEGIAYRIEIVERDDQAKRLVLKVNGNLYPVKIADAYDLLIKEMGFENQAGQKAKNITAPMPGLVLEVKVESGQEVQEGEALLILEAMKMENVLKAPADGVVKEVATSQGASVDKGQLLIEMA